MKEICKADQAIAKILPPVRPASDLVYVPSQFTLSFARKGKRYIYNTLTRQCLEAELPLRCKAGEGHDELIRSLFLVPEGKDECGFYNSVSSLLRVYSHKEGRKGYTILPTLACNARCVYCYEEGMKPVTMTPETTEQTIRYILDTHRGDRVTLHWFGGEPLLRPDLIDRICGGLREAGLNYRSAMISNGSLITPEIIHKMKADWNMATVQISVDGAEIDYIARKRYIRYSDEYHRLFSTVNAMTDAGIRINIRCNVDEENWDRIPDFLEDAKNEIIQKEKVRIYFAPLYDARLTDRGLELWKKVVAGRTMIEEAGFPSITQRSEKKGYRVNHCMADGSGVTIGPDGSLYPCEHCPPESRFGDIWHGVTDERSLYEFCRTDRTREKCRTCPYLPDCTSFASCPIEDRDCRKVHELLKLDYLCRLVDNADKGIGEEIPAC